LLEKKCDIELFDRGMYTTYLTPEGERVADQARRVLEEYERLVRLLAAIRRQARL
jgi:DNA-binding transcriptional LysR family regulator